ncbi:MAG TPA: NAD(P)/FAD-dependent oxidoreductase [Candidatus Acidoferrales bacterium]|jgi:NADH dehydrogenase|nr:NAD(P)/FAD-dependent oxidoreductase [Candidatus Acidoferrales bacterium]
MPTMLPMTQNVNWPRVVVVGGGFAGLNAAKALSNAPARVTVLDRKNHHTFQPLLYQVALAVLSPAEIASPIRNVLRRAKNTEVLLGEVTGFDLEKRLVRTQALDLPYDFLIVAAGATHAYFGHPEWEQYAPGLKTLEDATEIRRRVLSAFEQAEREAYAHRATPPLNFVVIGGGPTGVELAGAISDISRHYIERDFRNIDPTKARIILLEGGPRVLPAYPPDLSASAEKQLREMGVEVRTNAMVTNVEPGVVSVGQEKIRASVILWSAGVSASPLGRMLGVATDRAGRVLVEPDLSVPGHPEVFVAGDLAAARWLDHASSAAKSDATISDKDKKTPFVPGLAPAAIQMGRFAGRQVKRSLEGKPREAFNYWDKGTLATIGRSRAVADFGRFHVSGYFAWLSWLFIHLMFLIGFRNRILVMAEWAWAYVTYNHGARLITEPNQTVTQEKPRAKAG